MKTKLHIGYFAHWSQPPYKFVDFMREQGFEAEKIDYSRPGYLEKFDVVLIEQQGFNDYIENDELYIRDWVKRGGICLFMHQDYCRWAPCFLPEELGYTQLIHRHVPTILGHIPGTPPYMGYMMPWIEPAGRRLFSEPNRITPDEMLDWHVTTGSMNIVARYTANQETETVRTAALSCYLANPNWEILGSYMDPAVRDGALILKAGYGKGMFFLNQLLFPEALTEETARCVEFWKKYLPNLIAFFERFRAGVAETVPPAPPAELPIKKNYKLAIHMHSLDWYGADSAPGTINAIMRYFDFDICALALKDSAPYKGKLDTVKYSDDKVLFLDGQEYHPFNWREHGAARSHNAYHLLAIGIDADAYTPEFTRSLFSEAEVDAYLKRAVDYVHRHGGAVCATHPPYDTWFDYPVDAADMEPLLSLVGSRIENYWLSGRRKAIMNSVDLYGLRRMIDNPAVNFLYLQGEKPCRDSVVRAIRAGHVIAACGYDAADITLNGKLPGDELPSAEAQNGTLHIEAQIRGDSELEALAVYSGKKLIHTENLSGQTVSRDLPLAGCELDRFVRVEIQGNHANRMCCSTPFYLIG
ncbi:MAG: hypothetical protein MR051_09075 [Lentisphaeria bacterium]|nr:hypothetical protein [Lentisphaeria bacterium]